MVTPFLLVIETHFCIYCKIVSLSKGGWTEILTMVLNTHKDFRHDKVLFFLVNAIGVIGRGGESKSQ